MQLLLLLNKTLTTLRSIISTNRTSQGVVSLVLVVSMALVVKGLVSYSVLAMRSVLDPHIEGDAGQVSKRLDRVEICQEYWQWPQ